MYIILQCYCFKWLFMFAWVLNILPGFAEVIHLKHWNCSLLGNFLWTIAWILNVWLYWVSISWNVQSKNCISEEISIKWWSHCLAWSLGTGVSNTSVPLSQLLSVTLSAFVHVMLFSKYYNIIVGFKSDVEITYILINWETF